MSLLRALSKPVRKSMHSTGVVYRYYYIFGSHSFVCFMNFDQWGWGRGNRTSIIEQFTISNCSVALLYRPQNRFRQKTCENRSQLMCESIRFIYLYAGKARQIPYHVHTCSNEMNLFVDEHHLSCIIFFGCDARNSSFILYICTSWCLSSLHSYRNFCETDTWHRTIAALILLIILSSFYLSYGDDDNGSDNNVIFSFLIFFLSISSEKKAINEKRIPEWHIGR